MNSTFKFIIIGGRIVIDYSYVIDEKQFTIDPVMLFQLEKSFRTYEEKLLLFIKNKDLTNAEDILLDFCMKALQLPKKERLFAVRLFFTSFVTNIIRKQNNKGILPPEKLARAYELINDIEQWKNISEYMLHISVYIKRIKNDITLDHLLFKGNSLVEKALTIIYNQLKSNELTVNSIASQLEVSPTHITNLFKKHLGITLSQYIAQKKIEAIITELKHSNDSLHTIRKRFGFHNHSHFIQFFKKHTNLTPLQYLQRHVY